MAAAFSAIFSCCFRRRRKESVIPDEESRLIPAEATEPTPVIPHVVVIDHQKLKDRLGTIVRAKEGKMVNVNAQIPFNLHNQAVMDPSSSRSASLSTNQRYEFPQNSQRYTALATAQIPSNIASSSRGASGSRSSSTASVHYDSSRRGSLAPSETNEARNPTLNVRLVNKGYGSFVVGNTPSRRGRPRVRGGGGDGRTITIEIHQNGDAHPEQQQQQSPDEESLHVDIKEDLVQITSDNSDPDTPIPPVSIPSVLDLDPKQEKPPLPAPDFKIKATDIALSWGD